VRLEPLVLPIMSTLVVESPLGQMLANAAKRTALGRADMELGLVDGAPHF